MIDEAAQERSGAPALDVGIALSGGGLRAASFSLGALQALDQEFGLLRGPDSARYIAAVSGGSYIAGTLALVNAGPAAKHCDGELAGGATPVARPLAQGSPEVNHILRHSRYLVDDGGWLVGLLIVVTMVANVAVVLALVASAGLFASFVSVFSSFATRRAVFRDWLAWTQTLEIPASNDGTRSIEIWLDFRPSGVATLLAVFAFALAFAGVVVSLRRLRELRVRTAFQLELHASKGETDQELRETRRKIVRNTPRRRLYIFSASACFVVLFVTSIDVVRVITSTAFLSSPAWFTDNARPILWSAFAVAALIVLLLLLGLLDRLSTLGNLGRFLLGGMLRVLPVAILVLTLTWSIALGGAIVAWIIDDYRVREGYDPFTPPIVDGQFVTWLRDDVPEWGRWAMLIGLVVFPWLAMILLSVAPSAHDHYRRLLSSCFAVVRRDDRTVVTLTGASDVALSSLRSIGVRCPEILICAAANVSDHGVALAGLNALPIVFSPHSATIPTASNAKLDAVVLDRFGADRIDAKNKGHDGIGLTSAMAITGAAISPTMGRHTMPQFRPLLAMLGVRLGRWVPNPASPLVRLEARSGIVEPAGRDSFRVLREFFGRHSSSSKVLYASDGGHFENMGLVELVRRRCDVIWVVDASPNKTGLPLSLTQSLLLAEAESGVEVRMNLDGLEVLTASGELTDVVATGTIHYPEGGSAIINVVKLGITEHHSSIVKNYARIDRPFPFHPTIQQMGLPRVWLTSDL